MPADIVPIEGNEGFLPVSVTIDEAIAPAWAAAVNPPDSVGTRLVAQYVNLDGMQENMQAQYNAVSVIGRLENILVYAGSTNREVSLTFQFRANKQDDLDRVVERAMWLDALKMPWVSQSGLTNPPPPVILDIGLHLSMRAVILAATVTWVGPFEPGSLSPHGADVDVTFASVVNQRYTGPSFGGITTGERFNSGDINVTDPTNDLPAE